MFSDPPLESKEKSAHPPIPQIASMHYYKFMSTQVDLGPSLDDELFDTNLIYREIAEAGASKAIADVIISNSRRLYRSIQNKLSQSHYKLAEKDDVEFAKLTLQKEIEEVRLTLQKEIEEVRGDLKNTELKLQKEIEEVRLTLQKEIEKVRGDLKNTELKLQKEIEKVRSDLKNTELKLQKEIEKVRSEIKNTELMLQKEIKETELRIQKEISIKSNKIILWTAGLLFANTGVMVTLIKLL